MSLELTASKNNPMSTESKYIRTSPGNLSDTLSLKKRNQIRKIARLVAEDVRRILESESASTKSGRVTVAKKKH